MQITDFFKYFVMNYLRISYDELIFKQLDQFLFLQFSNWIKGKGLCSPYMAIDNKEATDIRRYARHPQFTRLSFSVYEKREIPFSDSCLDFPRHFPYHVHSHKPSPDPPKDTHAFPIVRLPPFIGRLNGVYTNGLLSFFFFLFSYWISFWIIQKNGRIMPYRVLCIQTLKGGCLLYTAGRVKRPVGAV